MFVTGDAGIGKTTLVEHALAGSEPAALWGRCHETEGAPAYWPWIQVLRRWLARTRAARVRRDVGAGASDLGRLVPALDAITGAVAAPPDDTEAARFRLFDSVTGLLRRAAADEPLVVVLEDLHWADRESVLLLEWLAPEIRDTHLLVIGTYRDAEMQRAAPLAAGALARVGERLPLAGLGERDVALLVGREPAGHTPLAATIHRLTEGNAFFVTELLELLRMEGAGPLADARPLRVPDSIRELIRRRLDPLPAETRTLLDVAAVLGGDLHVARLAEVAATTPPEALRALEPALATGVVQPAAGRAQRYRFSHALVQDALYQALPVARRAALHRRAGEVLERLYAADPEPLLGELAHHFLHAATQEAMARAVAYATRAGERAMTRLGFEEAAGHFARALDGVRAAGDPDRRLALLLRLGEAKGFSGDEQGGRAVFVEAARLAQERGAAEALARAALGFTAAGAETGVVNETGVALLERALAAVGDADSALRANLLSSLARALYFAPDARRREALSAEAVALARRTGSPTALVTALDARHFALWKAGTAEERLALATEVVTRAEASGQWDVLAEGRAWRILDLLELGAVTEATAELERHAALAERIRLPRFRWHVVLVRAALALAAGRAEEAERLGERAAGLRQTGTSNNAAAFWAVQLFHVRRLQGRLAEMRDVVAGIAALSPTIPIWRCGLALLDAETGRSASARAVVDDLAASGFAALPDDANRLPSLAFLAEAAALLGARERAGALYALLLPHAGTHVVVATTAALLGPVTRYLALVALASGDVPAAIGHGEAAIRACEAAGAAPDLVRARLTLARALERRAAPGDADRAAALRRQASDGADALGLPALLAPGGAAAGPPSATLRRDGDHWTIRYGDELVRLRDTKGVGYLLALLRRPDEPVDAWALAGAPGEDDPAVRERARLNVGRALTTVLRKIAAGSPTVGRHLQASVRMGVVCRYVPDPVTPLRWDLSDTA